MAAVGTEVGWMVPEPWGMDCEVSRGWRGVCEEGVGVLVMVRRVRVVRRVWMAERESGMGAMVVEGRGCMCCVLCVVLSREA